MKKFVRSILSIAMVLCLLSTSLFTGTFALSDSANILREDVVSAINELDVTADTTVDDIETAVTSVVADAEISWKLEFTKVLPTNGAKITLNGVAVDGGIVRGFSGSIKGILNVTSAGNNFDVAVDFTLEPTYETIDCKKQATINMTASTYKEESGYDAEADLVVIEQPSSGTQWSMPKNYFYTSDTDYDSTIKAVVVKYNVVNILDNAFRKMTGLKAVVFPGIVKMYSNSFYASKVEYIDFGTRENDSTSRTLEFATNAFAWTEVKNLYMGGYNAIKIGNGAFTGCDQMKQLLVGVDTITSVASGALNTQGDNKPSITTVVCQNATSATTFVTAGAAATIDVSKTPVVDYYSQVSAIKVIDEVTADYVVSAAEALDTADAFTVSAEKKDNVFEVSITDANSITATAYVETFAKADIEANIKNILDEYSYTDETTQDDITACIQNVLGNAYEIVWLEDYSISEKVDGAEVWARVDKESEYTLYGTVPGQDKATHGSFVIKNGNESVVIELNKILEKTEYKKYELNGVQKTSGAGIANSDTTTCHYDGTSELVIVNGSTIYGNHLSGTKIDNVLGAGVSDNIKAVIVKGSFDNGAWSAFTNLNGLEVVILNNSVITELGNANFRYCPNLKYIYIPDNILTTKLSGNGETQAAFYGCTSLGNVLVSKNFDKTTFYINKVNNVYVTANAVTRYNEDGNNLGAFYKDVSKLNAVSVSDLEEKIKALSSYDESYSIVIETTDTEFIVTINDLLIVTISVEQGIKENVAAVLSNYDASNETTADDIINKMLGIPGIESVEWSSEFGFEKILATNGARIRLNDKVVDGGIVRGHYGSITGIVTVTTALGDTFDAKVAITIDPIYETIDCIKSTTVTIADETDTYLAADGYDLEADLVIINVTNPTKNIPVNYFGATADIKNNTVKAVIVQDEVSTVLEKAFQYTSTLEAVVFNKVDAINNYGFYASGVKYVELGYAGENFKLGSANAFAWSKLTGLYIEDRDSIRIETGAFVGCSSLSQIYVDADTVESVTDGVISDITTVVCNGADAVTKFETAGVLSVIDATDREISIYDVNYDFKVDARDLVRLKKMVATLTEDTNYDVNNDGAVNATDLTAVRQELLDMSTNNEITVLNNTYRRLIQDNELNVAYFGGSVTNGYGATDKKYSWASRVTQYLKDKFPQADIDSLNAAIGGTGTEFGAYRAVQDLQLETRTPDLVFVEFAVNDVYDGLNGADSQKYMENIIRTIYSYAPEADIVMVFITNSGLKGADFDQLIAQSELAEIYGIPCINVGKALCDEMSEYLDMSLIDSNSPEWLEYFTDSVHPTDAGYEKYASYIVDYLDKVLYPHRKEKASKISYMPETPVNTMLDNPEIFNASGVDSINNFTISNAGYINTVTDGSTLTVTFTGTSLKLWCYAGPESSMLEYSVDGGNTKTIELYRGSENHRIFKVADGLSDTQHTVKMTFNNIASKVDIRYFLITGETNGKEFNISN